MLILGVIILIDLILVIFLISFLWTTIIGGVPYLPSTEDRIETMIKLAKIKKGDVVCDLGSGDGRIVISLAKKGIEAHGYELNLMFVLLSKYHIWRAGLKNAHIHWQNFMKVDLKQYDVIMLFVISYTIGKLGKKIDREAKKGTRIICNSYPIKAWKPKTVIDRTYLYIKK